MYQMERTVRSLTQTSPKVLTRQTNDAALRRTKIAYWILTLLMFVPGTLGAFAEAFTSGPSKHRQDHASARFSALRYEDPGRVQNLRRHRNLDRQAAPDEGVGLCRLLLRVPRRYGSARHYG